MSPHSPPDAFTERDAKPADSASLTHSRGTNDTARPRTGERPQPSSSTNMPQGGEVITPQSKEDWDEFIVRYAQGMLNTSTFPAGRASRESSPRLTSTSLHSPLGSPSHSRPQSPAISPPVSRAQPESSSPTASRSASRPSLRETSSDDRILQPTPPSSRPLQTSASGPSSRPSSARPTDDAWNESSSRQTPDVPSDSDVHPDISAAGPSNQDPNIPNIPSQTDNAMDEASKASDGHESSSVEERDYAYEPEGEDDSESSGQGKKKGKGKARAQFPTNENKMFRDWEEGDAVQEVGLTRENVRQLNIQSSKRRDPDRRRRKRHDEVHLAPVNKTGKESSGEDSDANRANRSASLKGHERPPRPASGKPRSRGSLRSFAGSVRRDMDARGTGSILLESGTGSTTNSGSIVELDYDIETERERIRDFYIKNGYLPAPRQTPESMRRRLRVIRRLGFDDRDRETRYAYTKEIQSRLQRVVRLAKAFFKCTGSVVSVVGKDNSITLAAEAFPVSTTEAETAFCGHTIVSAPNGVLAVPDTTKDWRFRKNPLVREGQGPIRAYAGAPLVIGKGSRAAVIGTLCVIDDKPREFSDEDKGTLTDLAEAVVSELELLYTQTASVESAKLHQISVDFLRRSLKSRPLERAGVSGKSGSTTSATSNPGSAPRKDEINPNEATSSSRKRKEGADNKTSEHDIDIYDEACSEIRHALDAYAVAVVDLSQFHLFYPAFAGSSTGGSSRTKNVSASTPTALGHSRSSPTEVPTEVPERGQSSGVTSGTSTEKGFPGRHWGWKNSLDGVSSTATDNEEGYSRSRTSRRARKTYALADPTAPSRTPQVLYIPPGRRTKSKSSNSGVEDEQLAVLGYSCEYDNFAFNFTSSPAAKRIISDFIAANVKTRQVWYTRDDSEGIAQSINHLMPPGTETSLAMPIFGFDGQVAFAVVACWTDPLYTYPSGAMQFVETIAGSLLASVMKERLHQAERAQLNFAAAASHELRTPVHQINAAASLLRQTLQNWSPTPKSSPESSLAIQQPPLAESPPALPGPAQIVSSPLQVSEPSEGTAGGIESERPTPKSTSPVKTAKPERPSFKSLPSDEKADAMLQLEIIESNGLALGTILENIIDTLDIGRLTSRMETKVVPGYLAADQSQSCSAPMTAHGLSEQQGLGNGAQDPIALPSFDDVVEKVVMESIALEERSRRIQASTIGNKSDEKSRGMGDVEVILEVLPRTRGVWKLAQDPGPLSRAIGKIVHNACKFTDKGHVTVTVQDVSRDVVLPAGYDNPIRTSIISIDVKDTGRGTDFLEREVLRPFSKTESFTPGSGLGLGLAQRMIELLGGKLAIASELGKGTIVHIEVPMHLYNEDNESDQEELDNRGERNTPMNIHDLTEGEHDEILSGHNSGGYIRASNPSVSHLRDAVLDCIRQDGIYLVGFDSSAAIKRAGRSILRQLKLNLCRLVPEIQYASLIVAPSSVQREALLDLARKAKEDVEIILIRPPETDAAKKKSTGSRSSSRSAGTSDASDSEAEGPKEGDMEWDGIRVRSVHRPIRPSVIAEIMRPTQPARTYEPTISGGGEGGAGSRSASQFTSPISTMEGSYFTYPAPKTYPHQHTVYPMSPGVSNSVRQSPGVPMSSYFPVKPTLSRMGTGLSGAQTTDGRTEPPTPDTSLPSIAGTAGALTEDDLLPSPGASGFGSPPPSPKLQSEMRIVPPLLKMDQGLASTNSNNQRRGSIFEDLGVNLENRAGKQSDIEDVLSTMERVRLDDRPLPSISSRSMSESDRAVSGEGTEGTSGDGDGEGGTGQSSEVQSTTEDESEVSQAPEVSKVEGPLRVLVVEDNDVNRKILTTMLKRTACQYAEARDGVEAVEQYREFDPHLILLDINMPRKDGFQAASEIRNIERKKTSSRDHSGHGMKCRILAVTAMSSERHRRKGMVECGIDYWLAKPVGIKKLKEEIERAKGDMIMD